MTTQTLENPATALKAVDALPEPVYPACKKLGTSLSVYQKFAADLEEYRGKAARAESDEQQALDDAELTENEAADRISRAQNLKSVYASRTASLERKLEGLLTELGTALVAGISEVNHASSRELEKRRELILERIIAALGGLEHASSRGSLLVVTQYSPLIIEIERLRLAPVYNLDKVPAANVVGHAQNVLRNLEVLIQQIGKEI